MEVLGLVYFPPLRRNAVTLEWEAAYAASFEVALDGTSVTITLREGLYWSDGEPLTAEGFVFAASVYQSGKVTVARSLSVNGEQTVWSASGDLEYTVSTGGQPYGSLLEIANIPPLPKHLLDPYDERDFNTLNDIYGLSTDPKTLVGNGPFVPVEIDLTDNYWVTLKKNPYYFEEDSDGLPLPYLSAVRFVGGNKINLFNSRDAELTVVSGTARQYITRAGAQVYNAGPGDTQVIFFNQNPVGVDEPEYTWLTTPEFRKAIAHIVNRARIVTEAYSGYASPAYLPIHPESPYYSSDAEAVVPAYSLGAAADLLDELGWTDTDADDIREYTPGVPLQLALIAPSGNTRIAALCNIITLEAAAVGISLTVSNPANFESALAAQDWQLACVGIQSVLDPALLDSLIPSYGGHHLSEPSQTTPRQDWEIAADTLWETVMEAPDGEARAEALQGIQQIWAEDLPWIYVAAPNVYEAYQGTIANVSGSVLHPFPGHGWRAIASRLFYQ